jgi:uncharacterized YccA/Bax inhibitor family protein
LDPAIRALGGFADLRSREPCFFVAIGAEIRYQKRMVKGSPALNENTFRSLAAPAGNVMTANGAMVKTIALLILTIVTAAIAWNMAATGSITNIKPILIGTGIGGLIIAVLTVFKPHLSPLTGPLYAVVKGAFVGLISMMFENFYNGIVMQAISLTLGIAILMAALYIMRIIRPTAKFKSIVISATGGIFLLYIATFLLGLFGIDIPYIHGSGLIGIGFSLFVVVIASLNLIIDFEMIEVGAQQSAPKYMEWYCGFSILVTIIWLYIEVLRLLAKLADRD